MPVPETVPATAWVWKNSNTVFSTRVCVKKKVSSVCKLSDSYVEIMRPVIF
jgi:hypothetical protein